MLVKKKPGAPRGGAFTYKTLLSALTPRPRGPYSGPVLTTYTLNRQIV